MMYKLLMAGDSILNITDKYIVVERVDGTVDIYGLSQDKGQVTVTENPVASIGYEDDEEDGLVEHYVTDSGVEIINF